MFCLHVCSLTFPPATGSLLIIPWLLFTTVDCQIPLYQDKLWANAVLGSWGLTLTQPLTACAVSAATATQAVFRAAGQCRYSSAGFLKGQASISPRIERQVEDLWFELSLIRWVLGQLFELVVCSHGGDKCQYLPFPLFELSPCKSYGARSVL